MKEEFYGNRSHSWRPSTHPQKRKGRKLDKSLNGDQPKSADKMTVHSDSKVLLCKSKDNDKKVREGQMNFRKNNSNDFDEQFNSDSLRGQLVATGTKIGAAKELNDVGFDTQMAAEAMEALFYGETATDPNSNQGVQSISKGSSKGSFRVKTGKKISSSLRKDVSCSDVARFRRRSKRTKRSEESSVLMEKHSKSVGKDCNMELLLPKLKKAKLRGGGSIRKQHPEEVHTTPIAHRTGQSVKNVEMAETMVSNCRKGRKRIKEAGFLQESRSGSTDVELSEVSKAKVEVMQGRRVLITPNTKPGKETILRLVTTVHGQAVERIGRSAMKDDKFPDDLLVLSCEEDYEISVRFLEIGAEIFSSELLLNGIVTQKLDYESFLRIFSGTVFVGIEFRTWLSAAGI
ncbi:putative DNAJ heat shock N-terminal domain-containing protein [Hibiscus syriacus]|uniref:DNAJ heat shock N-terminal domain-containing protein n=1 Tax=Hibiscus syriacus TaxID=106335 RepID=A0A6A3C3B8_HIBSY|nr:putative DNAJ heat shock N-terminal domain-containing protein [Hibiscus syriacus]